MMLLSAALLLGPAQAERRYALVIGNNQGDAADPPLSYAEEDARRVAQLLQDLGQMPADAVVTLTHPDATRVRETLENVTQRIQSDLGEEDVIFLLYYSGHADASDLHLSGSRLPLLELRQRVMAVQAQARVLVVDACRAGELTRLKGGKSVEPFTIIAAAPPSTEGMAIMTSAAVG